MSGYVYMMVHAQEVHGISWTIPHCVLVLKLIGKDYVEYKILSELLVRVGADKAWVAGDCTSFAPAKPESLEEVL